MRLTRWLTPLLLPMLVPAVCPLVAAAQTGIEFSSYSPTIRVAAMAGAGSAIFWGGNTADGANPALIAFHEGVQYEFSTVTFFPEEFGGGRFASHRITLGGAGLGLAMAGRPFGIGRQRIDFGTFSIDSEDPVRLAEDIATWGVGATLSGLVRLSHGSRAPTPGFARHFDVAAGYNHKVESLMLGKQIFPDFGSRAHDFGLLACVTPLNTFGSDAAHAKRIDVSYGWSVIDQDDDDPRFGPSGFPRVERNGVAARFLLDRAPGIAPYEPRSPWAGDFSPWVSVSFAFDFDHRQYANVQRVGLELIMANVLALRVGHVEVEGNDTTPLYYGGGVGYSYGHLGRVSYDFASTPYPGEPRIDHHGVTVRLDPLALARTIH